MADDAQNHVDQPGAGPEDDIAPSRPSSRRRRSSWAVASVAVLGVAAAVFTLSQPDGDDGGRPDKPSAPSVEAAGPSPGRAWCSDDSEDVFVQIGGVVRQGGQYDDTAGLDIEEVSVEVTGDDLLLRMDLVAPPSTYASTGMYSYEMAIHRTDDAQEGVGDPLYTMLVGSSAVQGQAPTTTSVLTDTATGSRTPVPEATFTTDDATIAMRVPLDAVADLPRTFEFSASTTWTLDFQGDSQGIYTDRCPGSGGAVTPGPLPVFPAAGTTPPDKQDTPTTVVATGYPTLDPATVPSAVPICDEPPQTVGTGFPISDCSSGTGINRQTWDWYAADFPALLALGPDATSDQIQAAACTALSSASTSQLYSVLETAGQYYDWPGPVASIAYDAC